MWEYKLKTVEADQDEANPNEMGLIHEVEVAAAALKLTDQPDDLTMIQKTLTVILTSFWLKWDPSYEKKIFTLKCSTKIQPTWFIQVNRLSDSMWPNVSFLLT